MDKFPDGSVDISVSREDLPEEILQEKPILGMSDIRFARIDSSDFQKSRLGIAFPAGAGKIEPPQQRGFLIGVLLKHRLQKQFQPGLEPVELIYQVDRTGGMGAGLVTPEGPVEVYRMMCQDGKTFMARCELRQCKSM